VERGSGAKLGYLIIFLTGAATLALELLASRILTPYFGVSLYIWTSILAITLTFLAIGYDAGGRLARRRDKATCILAFFAAPVVSVAAIVVACLIYPHLFPWLAGVDLLLGSIVAAAIILAVPLVVLSAMNPLLIAINLESVGDAGAGRVFFISTVGSVVGVIATAFLLIPYVTNFRGLLLLAIILSVLPIAGLRFVTVKRHRSLLTVAAAGGLVIAGGLFLLAPSLLGKDRDIAAGDYIFRMQAEYTSVFGNLKVVKFADRNDPSLYITLYLTDGLVQNRLLPDGNSYSEYTHALSVLSAAYAPEAKRALVLGLGAGVLPRDLAQRGLAVDAVEINDSMVAAMREHAGAENGWRIHIGDARTFVRGCAEPYDLAVVDLFHGDGTPDYLLTAEFFADLRRCLTPDGVAVMNAFALAQDSANYRGLIATVQSAFPHIEAFRRPMAPDDINLNTYLVAMAGPREPVNAPLEQVPGDVREGLVEAIKGRRIEMTQDPALVITDEHNIFSILNADDQIALRRVLVQQLPPEMLVN
jgi:predicted membrane-bound spermidine synthase